MSSTPAYRQAAATAGQNAGQGQVESTDPDVDVGLIEIRIQVILLHPFGRPGGACWQSAPT